LKAPLAVRLEIISVALPVFVKVTVWAELVDPTIWMGKVKPEGARLTAGATVPVPANVVVRGLPGSLSETVILLTLRPVVVGVKVILNAQLAPIASVAGETGQVFV